MAVGVDHRVDTVAQGELGQDSGYVSLDGLISDVRRTPISVLL
jgi:hypothetical protein